MRGINNMEKIEEVYPILIGVEDGYWVCSHSNIEWVHVYEESS